MNETVLVKLFLFRSKAVEFCQLMTLSWWVDSYVIWTM